MRSNLEDSFPTRYEFYSDPARLAGCVQSMHRAYDGNQACGGAMLYGWLADRLALDTIIGSQQATGVMVWFDDFAAEVNGGPYVDLDGATECIYIADAAWQETGQEDSLFVWHWCNAASMAATATICSKYDTNGNNCSWRMIYNQPAGAFQFVANATGNPANDVPVSVTYTEAVDTWYFVAGFWKASTLLRAWVGAATDAALTVGSLAVGVPATLFDGTAPLCIGSSFNNAPTLLDPWNGLIGVGGARVDTPAGTAASYPEITAFASRLFHLTRFFYQV